MEALSELEQSIARKLATARFPAYSASKRFARDLEAGYIKQLSDRGRKFMAYVVHRFRRQYRLTEEEAAWVANWKDREIPPDPPKDKATNGKLVAPAQTETERKLAEWERLYGKRDVTA